MVAMADGKIVPRQIDASPGGQADSGQSFEAWLASLFTALVIFGIEFLVFYILKTPFKRIYAPRTYLVPERERTTTSNAGFIRWVLPVFRTSNSEFIQKCGLDAYLFLRYLRMLIKIFLPLAILILPILLPVNYTSGRNASGLDQFGWQNIDPPHIQREWAHLILSIIVILWVWWVTYDELRDYIRLRQAYLTSPQHRIRASATTVLVQAIPRKWLSLKALDELFDVFPGGVRNIWLNRDFDELNDKVKLRNKYAKALENAETNLIKKAVEAKKKALKEKEKNGSATPPLSEQPRTAASDGMNLGDPGQIPFYHEDNDKEKHGHKRHSTLEKVGHGMKKTVGTVKQKGHQLEERMEEANVGAGFDPDLDDDGQTDGRGNQDILHHEAGKRPPHWDLPQTKPDDDDTTMRGRSTDVQSPISPAAPSTTHHTEKEDVPIWKFWKRKDTFLDIQNPQPNRVSDEVPLQKLRSQNSKDGEDPAESMVADTKVIPRDYPEAYDADFEGDDDDALWKEYLTDKDRETMRLPVFKVAWWPALPLMGEEVDTIYFCRKELARLNKEIEIDQKEPERFPLMNSAFIQFNNQVAAHMACQSVTSHIPKYMFPREVEISPDDILWDNLSIKWWERYVRKSAVLIAVIGIIIVWAIPVAFTGALSSISTLGDTVPWLAFLNDWPQRLKDVIQGVLPPALLAALLALLPIVLRFLSTLSGHATGVRRELSVQAYYFAFLFVQVFLVVTLSKGLFETIAETFDNPLSVTQNISQNMPKAANYFFSYMILQALTVSAGQLVQIAGLFFWFIWGPLMDSTARQKFNRQKKLPNVKWGTFFPIYTNLSVLGLVYTIISPLILIFCLITFSLFWVVYRYQTLYVNRNRIDTGGLLFPRAVNQLYTGLYVMEVCLAALFFIAVNETGDHTSVPQGIIMIIMFVFTVLYHFFLNDAVSPLFQYIPITMEDDAVRRDEEFARLQNKKFGLVDNEQPGDDINDLLKQRERNEAQADRDAEEYEMATIEANRREPHDYSTGDQLPPRVTANSSQGHWSRRRSSVGNHHSKDATVERHGDSLSKSRSRIRRGPSGSPVPPPPPPKDDHSGNGYPVTDSRPDARDLEAQQAKKDASEFLFEGFHDEIEDLSVEERDVLVRRAFQHAAVRANRPCIWIPRDEFGISDYELRRTQKLAGDNIWISNRFTKLDEKNRVLYSRPPPDFDARELMQL